LHKRPRIHRTLKERLVNKGKILFLRHW